ncbi:hypothetical protein T4C_8735 [Trichinella pseudospiralis]|uniref:Uncharacterized protein n=1 Tax=Trichinella pseudospiralis TaxID=6337 RepID=A0A0V1GQ90_TRIPS|nr:hypothetical protein T4C_8735 [Trichinella pseudospiralis]
MATNGSDKACGFSVVRYELYGLFSELIMIFLAN